MPQKTHYQDDLFVLSLLVKTLDSSLAVEADPEFFRSKVRSDLAFLDATLRGFGELLTQNTHLIERQEYLKLLERIERAFVGALGRLLSGDGTLAESFEGEVEGIRSLEREHRALLAEVGGLLSAETGASGETDLVSSDELNELLRGN